MELMKAHQQWKNRPEDETFATIEAAYEAALNFAKSTRELADVNPSKLRVEVQNDEMYLTRGSGGAYLSHWAFGQLASRIGAPSSYLRQLPATLATQNLNHGLKARYGSADNPITDETVNLLIHSNGVNTVQAFTSERYTRIWNHELLRRMRDFGAYGWANPVPFNQAGATAHPTIYVSDHDMFVFQVNNENRISEPGNPDGLGRGFFVENSEVGASKLRVTTFLFRYMCSNHIIWGAKDVNEIALRHVGSVRDRLGAMMSAFEIELTKYANESASEVEGQIRAAKRFTFGGDREKVLDEVFKRLRGNITRKALESGYELAERHELTDGAPNTAWGLAQGVTRYSQQVPFADERVALDRAAGKIVELAF